jgi:primase-polymerase (primpol)-like protein
VKVDGAAVGPKNRERSEVEHLKSVIRGLEKQINELKKQVGQANKKVGRVKKTLQRDKEAHSLLQEYILNESVSEQKVLNNELCPTCNEAVVPVNLGARLLITCSSCGYRKAVKTSG